MKKYQVININSEGEKVILKTFLQKQEAIDIEYVTRMALNNPNIDTVEYNFVGNMSTVSTHLYMGEEKQYISDYFIEEVK